MLKRFLSSLVLAIFTLAPAHANDSTAQLGAGGIILVYAEDIAMEKEDLFISTDEVRVKYQFRNRADRDRTYLVAFPMPEIEAPAYLEIDIGVPDREKENFMNFSATVAGKPVETRLDMRALTGGIDITDRISALGIPLNPLSQSTQDAIDKTPRETLQELIDMGALRVYEKEIWPQWSLRASYYWLQTFPANGTLDVEHSYTPAAGSSFFYSALLDDRDYAAKYCIDDGTARAIRRKLGEQKAEFPYLLTRDIQYVLSSGANWFGPIKDFRLVVDKGSPDAILSLCMDGVKKISPTQFEVRRTDFEPTKDIDLIVVGNAPAEQ
jgi:hypothetical protein